MSGRVDARVKIGFDELDRNVISAGLCTSCAACYTVCPIQVIGFDLSESKPRLIGECAKCSLCYNVCPQTLTNQDEFEVKIFGLNKPLEVSYGYYEKIYESRSRDPRILDVAQDGGTVTSILCHALESGLVDAVLATKPSSDNPFKPVPWIATTVEEVIKCAGSRYSLAPIFYRFREAGKMGIKSVACVGMSHIATAARRISQYRVRGLEARLNLIIGLFCFEAFPYDSLRSTLASKLNLPEDSLYKLNIKRGRFIVTIKDGKTFEIPIKRASVKPYDCCLSCRDFAARLADISVGSLGLDGWNVVIARGRGMVKLLEEAAKTGWIEIREPSSQTLESLERLSNLKMSR
ncbi:MAG: coenzyme F420 hydrogenase/dehydrogenase beta subunit N-terminal domain-containing protein [Nitrososphaerota archaeon]|nr:Coenzyme F420 hydrogenase/dehydrogenase, beta subunit C-terminal domain [Candidatus Bathyarchaeota archaeon]MCX8161991.1 Coenzyme F420 hydrogenase/dehydrogenase, beta subunit C-terminal domain [Candidatus Bathyarchaeota archaeon]MDW8061796.1 coenzyme F420 hydrogenase/dehydrogenase beta subunit N-terminal domain-containing protein [Nitrososphaerota archaeon]